MVHRLRSDSSWLAEALKEARLARDAGEVPVGCVVVARGRIIGRGHNQVERLKDATAHAEMIALSAAQAELKTWRLKDAVVYATIEPCVMCATALVLTRVKKLVFGAFDEKFGGCGSRYDIVRDGRLNHRVQVKAGVREDEARELMREFFAKKRKQPGEMAEWTKARDSKSRIPLTRDRGFKSLSLR